MRRLYQLFGGGLLLLYGIAEWTGWEMSSGARGAIPPSARNVGGYRSYHSWSGGK